MHSRIFFQRRQALLREEPIRDPVEIHHALNVLRLKTGDAIELVDGEGDSASAVLTKVSKISLEYDVISSQGVTPPVGGFTLAFSLLKGPANDRIIRFGTELAVRRFLPLVTSRTVHYSDIDSSGKIERWRRITISAMKQCGRLFLPVLERPVSIEQLAGETDRHDENFFAWEKAEVGLDPVIFSSEGSFIGVIGPEGGFSDSEAETLESMNFRPVSLGSTRLRAETAALAVCTIAMLPSF